MGSYVELSVTTDEQEFNCVRRFPLSITVGELKSQKRVELLVGVPYNAMSLELRQQDDITRRNLLVDDSATLNMLSLTNGMILHVRDERGPNVLGEEIFSPADGTKFELSDEKYNQKTNTVRAWLKEQKLKCHQDYSADNESDRSEELASKLRSPFSVAGEVHFKPGIWVGVHYDNPVGKNDGSVDGHRYFECPPNYGSFVRPQFIGEEAEEI
ncbi:CAP-Gly domain protein [Trichuris suis]|nr:CAP-Gly domain protein [Trichuris suis]